MMIQGSGRRRRRTGMRRRGARRMRGRGIFDTIKNIGKKAFNIARSVPIISTGLNLAGRKDLADAAKSIGFGRRRKRRTRRGGRRRATKRRFSVFGGRKRRMRGRGIFDTIKNIGKKAFNIARSVPIISTGLKLAGQDKYSDMAKSIGLGRRRKRRTRRGGRMSVYGGRRRRYRRKRGGRRRATKRRFSVFGGRRRRYRRKRVGGRKRRSLMGGLFRKLKGIIPLAMGGRRRKRRTRRRMGGRKRTYRIGLFSRRR